MPAYNQYYPQNYQYPAYPAYQPYQPMIQQPPAPQYSAASAVQPVQPAQSSIIWISGAMEAQAYPVAPNNAVTLWSTSEPVVYLKQADATGKPTLKVYDLVERSQTASEGASGAEGKLPDYATKEELAEVVGAVQSFNGVIGDIKAEVEKMSGDMYGVVGKKKTAAKKTEEGEE